MLSYISREMSLLIDFMVLKGSYLIANAFFSLLRNYDVIYYLLP